MHKIQQLDPNVGVPRTLKTCDTGDGAEVDDVIENILVRRWKGQPGYRPRCCSEAVLRSANGQTESKTAEFFEGARRLCGSIALHSLVSLFSVWLFRQPQPKSYRGGGLLRSRGLREMNVTCTWSPHGLRDSGYILFLAAPAALPASLYSFSPSFTPSFPSSLPPLPPTSPSNRQHQGQPVFEKSGDSCLHQAGQHSFVLSSIFGLSKTF